MGISSSAVQFGGALLYVGSGIAYLGYLTFPRPVLARVATGALVAGVIGHALCFVVRSFGATLPVTSNAVVLSLLAWTLAGVWLVAQAATRTVLVGAFIAPVAAVFALLAAASPPGDAAIITPVPSLLLMHLGMVYLGTAIFALSGAVGIAYRIQERCLKKKQLGGLLHHLPSLEALDRVGYRSQAFGFVLLTLSLLTGAMMAALGGSAQAFHTRPEVWATVILWLWYAGALQSRLMWGWHGRKAALFSVVGFVAFILLFLTARFVGASSP